MYFCTQNQKYRMKHNRLIVIGLLLLSTTCATAQESLSLQECRRRALEANKGLKQAELKCVETDALEKAALMQLFPKVSANGGYMWMEKSVNLLNDEQKDRLRHMGDKVQGDVNTALHNEFSDLNIGDLNIGDMIADRLEQSLVNADLSGSLNSVGNDIVEGMETDTRNMGVVTFTLTQPIYMGGKLLAMHRTAQLMSHLAGVELDKKQQETLVAVDEAYWQVVSVEHKRQLAERYAALLDTLTNNVELLVEAQMATQGDLAKVRVKRNEAQMMLTKANNGLRLSKMLLAERCGMPLNSDFQLRDAFLEEESSKYEKERDSLDDVYSRRTEMRMLRISDSIARQSVVMAASTLQPNIAFTGGYLLSNPNVFDGFSNTWGGTWMAGVAVNLPLVHPAGIFAIKAAKTKRREVAYQMEEARELIALQVEKLCCELEQACSHLTEAQSDLEAAEENMKLADESFKAGMCSSSDLMAAQTAWMKAQGEVIDARIEIAMGRTYLDQAMGY